MRQRGGAVPPFGKSVPRFAGSRACQLWNCGDQSFSSRNTSCCSVCRVRRVRSSVGTRSAIEEPERHTWGRESILDPGSFVSRMGFSLLTGFPASRASALHRVDTPGSGLVPPREIRNNNADRGQRVPPSPSSVSHEPLRPRGKSERCRKKGNSSGLQRTGGCSPILNEEEPPPDDVGLTSTRTSTSTSFLPLESG